MTKTQTASKPRARSSGKASASGARRVAILILGMHRSGTSALSGVLAQLGFATPATPIRVEPENPKGFYESRLIARFNDQVLASAGTSWDDWTAFHDGWYQSPVYEDMVKQAVDLLPSEFGQSPLIVLKDPRICRLAPFWFEALDRAGYTVHVISSHRDPAEVGMSLETRNGFDQTFGQLLWLRNVMSAERDSRKIPRIFIGYSDLLEDWRAQVLRIETQFNLRMPRQSSTVSDEIDAFLTPSMHHYSLATQAGKSVLPCWVREASEIFDRWRRSGEDQADWAKLDQICTELDSVTPAFDQLVRKGKDRIKVEAEMQALVTQTQTEAVELRAELSGKVATAEIAQIALEELREKVSALGAEISELKSENQKRCDTLLAFEASIKELRATAKKRQREIEAERDIANAKLSRVLNSRSIRITAPFRALNTFFKRNRH